MLPSSYIGGAETITLHIAKLHQFSKKYRASLLFLRDGPAVEIAKGYGLDTYIVENTFKLSQIFKLIFGVLEIREFLKSRQIRVVHCVMPYGAIVGALASLFLKLKIVWFQHGPVGGILDQIAGLFSIDKILFCSKYLENSHESVQVFSKSGKYRNQVIHLSPGEGEIGQQIDLPPKSKKKRILLLGRICEFKGHKQLAKAFSKVVSEASFQDWEVIIAGSAESAKDKVYYEDLNNVLDKLQIKNKFTFLGNIRNKIQLFEHVDLLVNCSLGPESFGLTIIEAMENRIPVLCGNEAGPGEIANDEIAFTYSSINDWNGEKLSEVLKLIFTKWNNDKFQSELAEKVKNAKLMVQKRYNDNLMIEEIEGVYEEILK